MSTAAVAEPTTETEGAPAPPVPVSAAEKGQKALFKYSAYVHVGDGAEECQHGEDGKCREADHFHAWVRLANQFQMRDIQEKAAAVKARKIRALRDPDSDARVVMEEELDTIRATGLKELVVDEIIDSDFQEIYVEAVKTVDDIDADMPELESDDADSLEPVKLYADIDQDREEYQRLQALPEDQRGEDFDALEQRVADYSRAIEDERQRIMEARKAPLMEQSWDQLIDIVRRDRIDTAGAEAYLQAFNTWHWFVCTFKPVPQGRPGERVFKSYNEMRFEADGFVIAALESTFNDLESRLAHSRAVGKS